MATDELYCRRDIVLPELEFRKQMQRLELVEELRVKAGRSREHPTVLAEKALLHMLRQEHQSAKEHLQRAIELNRSGSGSMPIRDTVEHMIQLSRCHYVTEDFRVALTTADEARVLADTIDPGRERDDYRREAAAPELEYMPVVAYGYFGACDARINHGAWKEDTRLEQEFNGLWNDAGMKHGVPQVWRTPIKISIVSDPRWCERAESYVLSIAQSLYVNLAPDLLTRSMRLLRSYGVGFKLRRPATAAAATAIVCCAIANDEGRPFRADNVDQQAAHVIGELTGQPLDLHKLYGSYVHFVGEHVPLAESVKADEVQSEDVQRATLEAGEARKPVHVALVTAGGSLADV
jgi:hypothetical protein